MLLITSGHSTTLDSSVDILLDYVNCNTSVVVNWHTSEYAAWYNCHRLQKLDRKLEPINTELGKKVSSKDYKCRAGKQASIWVILRTFERELTSNLSTLLDIFVSIRNDSLQIPHVCLRLHCVM